MNSPCLAPAVLPHCVANCRSEQNIFH
uniref:Uncharacterized protein n=1 Tax=Arundo donax TaxID=35708 RepID=A0A0A9AL76_ARUDO